MTRYVTLRTDDPNTGFPVVEIIDADQEEVSSTLNELYTDADGNTVERVSDPGGELRVLKDGQVVKVYPAGEWRSCAAASPDWFTDGAAG